MEQHQGRTIAAAVEQACRMIVQVERPGDRKRHSAIIQHLACDPQHGQRTWITGIDRDVFGTGDDLLGREAAIECEPDMGAQLALSSAHCAEHGDGRELPRNQAHAFGSAITDPKAWVTRLPASCGE
ncbi:hypothetical protein [Arhodomonas sp. KWT]|uniref:hypothetical protein n=1 Tax=Arhodomonas sp. KWT TaxID=2679915 RepID=UPI0013D13C56|nr:hypothetical protein [Arhodomonas sp. KWT]